MAVSSSVIVVSQRPGSWLADCVASALLQASEVIVVDNGSDEAEASAIARALGARVVRAPGNLGFAGGVNLGLRHARGDLVALLNDDAVAGPGWIDTAGAVLADPTVAAVTPKVLLSGLFAEIVLEDEAWYSPGDHRPPGPSTPVGDGGRRRTSSTVWSVPVSTTSSRRWSMVVPPIGAGRQGDRPSMSRSAIPSSRHTIRVDGEPVTPRSALCTLVNHAGNFLERHGIAGDYGFAAPDDGRFDQAAERFGFSGTAPVFRAETLSRVGGMATAFFAYNEDTDWCLRARLAGLRIVYDPRSSVRHRLSATSGGRASPFVRFLAQRNALLCLSATPRPTWPGPSSGAGSGKVRAGGPTGHGDETAVGADARGCP